MTPIRAPKRPCGSCPYRQDVPSGVWSEDEYEKLPEYDKSTGEQPVGVFMCHQQDGCLCAGWAGCHDMENSLGLRFAVSFGELAPEEYRLTINYVSPIPLFASGAEAAAHGLADVKRPDAAALRTIHNLERKRARREAS